MALLPAGRRRIREIEYNKAQEQVEAQKESDRTAAAAQVAAKVAGIEAEQQRLAEEEARMVEQARRSRDEEIEALRRRDMAQGLPAKAAAEGDRGAVGEAMRLARLPGESQRAYRARIAQLQGERNASQVRSDEGQVRPRGQEGQPGVQPGAVEGRGDLQQPAQAGAEAGIGAGGAQAVDLEAHKAATSPKNGLPEPSDAQKEAGNYTKGHAKVGGLDVSIENPAGSKRRPEWPTLKQHYGYIRGVPARAPDKDHVDVFVKPGTPEDYSGDVYVVDQNHADGRFDEPKVMIGFGTQDEARAAYLENYTKGWESRVRGITPMPFEQFKAELQDQQAFQRPHAPAQKSDEGALSVYQSRPKALRAAKRLTAAGQKHQVISHPTEKGRFAVVPVEEKQPSEAQIKAREAAAERLRRSNAARRFPNPKADSLIEWLAKRGGVDMAERDDVVGEGNRAVNGSQWLFRHGGGKIDELATRAHEAGYLSAAEANDVDGGVAALKAKIAEEFNGQRKHFSDANDAQQTEDAATREEADLLAAAEAYGIETQGKSIEEIKDAVTHAAQAAEVIVEVGEEPTAENIEQVETFAEILAGMSPEQLAEVDRRFGHLKDEEFKRAVVEFAQEIASADQRENAQAVGGGEVAGEAPAEPAAQEVAAAEPTKAETPPALELTQPTPAELLHREQLAAARAQREAAEAQKALVDEQREAFRLTGSDRPADVGAAAGQQDLLAAPVQKSTTPQNARQESAVTPEQPQAEGEETSPAYRRALDAFRSESAVFRKAQEDYRARRIGDAEFLAARKRFDNAQSAMDEAERDEKAAQEKPAVSQAAIDAIPFEDAPLRPGAEGYYIATGETGAMFTLRYRYRGDRVQDDYITNLSIDKQEAIRKAREYIAGSNSAVKRLNFGAPEQLREIERSKPAEIDTPEARAEVEAPDNSPSAILSGAGLVVHEMTSKAGRKYWAVSGDTRTHSDLLDRLGFAKPFKMGGTWYRSVFDSDPTARLVAALQGQTPPAQERQSLDAETTEKVLRANKITVTKHGDAWVVEGKKTYDLRGAIKDAGGRWNGSNWIFDTTRFPNDPSGTIAHFIAEATGFNKAPEPIGDDAGPGEVDARLKRERERQDARADERLDGDGLVQLVGEETRALLERGGRFGIPTNVIREQIEDAGAIVNAFKKGKPLFILGSEAGSGKTFVLGAAIKEMRAKGHNKFVYVTMNQDLIAQIKADLKDFGVEDVSFHTYSAMSTKGELDTDGAVLIFDEAHNVKNVGGQTARADLGQRLIGAAKMTVFASATPFENPVEARYMAATGIFDTAGGFNDWAKMYGAAVKRRKAYNPRTGAEWIEEIVYWPGRGKAKDGAAARDWLFKQGIMTQRAMKIDPKMVSVNFERSKVDQKWVDLYEKVTKIYDAALARWTDQNGNPVDAKIFAEMSMHRENVVKRILEAAKAPFAIEKARQLLVEGRRVVIFTETKADRAVGRWRRSAHFKDDTLYDYPQMQEMMSEWKQESGMARMMREAPPPRPFAEFIFELAGAFHTALGEPFVYELPSVQDEIVTALGGPDKVAIYTGSVPNATATRNKADFLADRKKVIVATMAKGGTGLSLHDKVGNRPTVQLNINLPWKATGVDQVSGRVARYGLQSNADIVWLFAQNIPWEATKLAPRVGARMRDMGALVKGIDVKAANLLDGNFDFEGTVDAKGGDYIEVGEEDPYEQAERLEAQRRQTVSSEGGFFETPFPLAVLMTRVSGVRPGDRMLEPSAGRGNLMRFLPDGVEVTAVEQRTDNADELARRFPKARLERGDFLAKQLGRFDVVAMNPPFERKNGVGAQDVAHVLRAYEALDDGGRLVAIMGEGPFFRDTQQERDFRQWLDGVGATVIQLPENAFKNSGTGVRTRMIVVDKGGESGRSDLQLGDLDPKALRDLEAMIPAREAVRRVREPGGVEYAVTAPAETVNVHAAINDLKTRFPNVDFFMGQTFHGWKLHQLEVPKGERNKGVGSAFMSRLSALADKAGVMVELSPGQKDAHSGTTSRARLVRFYRRFGFVENKGRRKDFTLSSGMYRRPVHAAYNVSGEVREPQRPGPGAAQRARTPGASLDLFTSAAVPGTQTQRFQRITVEAKEVGRKKVGFTKVTSPAEAAAVFQDLNRSPRERFQILGLDANRKPVAFFDLFAGTLTQTSVYPREVWTHLFQTPGIRYVWMAHQHPSGVAEPSRADELLTDSLGRFLRRGETGIDMEGHVVIAGDRYAAMDWGGVHVDSGLIAEAKEGHEIPIMERVVTQKDEPGEALNQPRSARDLLRKLALKESGLLLLDAQHRVIGWLPMNLTKMESLKTVDPTTGIGAILRDIGRTNAAAAMAYAPAGVDEQQFMNAARNVGHVLTAADVQMLDFFWPVGEQIYSAAERGVPLSSPTLFSRVTNDALKKGAGITQAQFRDALTEAFGRGVADKLLGEVIVPLESQAEMPEHIVPFVREGDTVYGFYDPKTDKTYAILENLSPEMVRGLVMHEVGVHYGLRRMLGDQYAAVERQMSVMRRGGNKAVIDAFNSAEREAADPGQVNEEAIAYLVQNAPELPLVKRIISAVKAFLFRRFGILGDRLTTDDIVTLTKASVRGAAERASLDGGGPIFARRIFREGYRTVRDFVVPETPEYEGNMTGDLASVPVEAARGGVEAIPVRMPVGIEHGPHIGYGLTHLKGNADRESRRGAPAVTNDQAENLIRNATEVLRSSRQIYTEAGRVVFRSPNMRLAVLAQRKERGGESYYEITTVVPSERSVWGNPVWVGRLTFPTVSRGGSEPPYQSAGLTSSAASPERAGVQTEKFQFNRPGPRVEYKKWPRFARYAQDPAGAPLLAGERVNLLDPEYYDRRSLGRRKAYAAKTYNDKGEFIGVTTLGWREGKVSDLFFIRTFDEHQRNGYARDVVGMILQHNGPESTLRVHNILRTARPFWRSIGTTFHETEQGTDGLLTLGQFESAGREGRAGLVGGSVQPGEGPADVGQGQGGPGEAGAAGEVAPSFSRASAHVAALQSARTLFDDLTRSDRALNRVISKFNTPFHIAKVRPEFAPVYDEAQEFANDLSRFANEAADQAKDLLPRIDSVADVLKLKVPSDQAVRKVGEALYAGTLWGGGSPLEGRVWTDEELSSARARDGNVRAPAGFSPLSEEEISLYRQALASVNQALTEHSKSLIWRLGRIENIDLPRQYDLADTAEIARNMADNEIGERTERLEFLEDPKYIEDMAGNAYDEAGGDRAGERAAAEEKSALKKEADRLREEIAELEAFKEAVNDIETKTNGLIEHGYFPAMRFGQYFVNVARQTDSGWEEVYFERFETQAAANAARRELQEQYQQGHAVTSGVMNDEAFKLFNGLNLDALETFAAHTRDAEGRRLDADPLMQEYMRIATSERSSLKRQIHRKGIAGYSVDTSRVLAQFVVSNATATSRNYHAAEMRQKALDIKSGDLQKYATRYVTYLQDPQEEAQFIRSVLANYYILGSLAFGAVNMTQPILMSAPMLSQTTSWADAMAKLAGAAKDMLTGRKALTEEERGAYERASKAGVVSPQEIHQIRAEGRASMLGDSPAWQKLESIAESHGLKLPGKLVFRKASFLWGSIYSLTEQWNRGTTFLAAYRIAKEKGLDPYSFAVNAVNETQGVYNRANRPMVSRGMIGAPVMTFKQFSISYLELAKRLYTHDKKAFAVMMLTLMVLAGAEGLPFAEDVEDLIDSIGQWLGYGTNSKKALRKLATDTLGKDIGDVLLHGFSAIPGVPLDVSYRLGMQNVIPGTAALKTSEPDKTRDMLEILGPAASLFRNAAQAGQSLATGDSGKLHLLLPKGLQDLRKGLEMARTGEFRDLGGRKVVETDMPDAFVKMVGFQPADVARRSRLAYQEQQDIAMVRVVESAIAGLWARGLADGEQDRVLEAREMLREWNLKNPHLPIRVQQQQLARRVRELKSTREDRIARTAPREVRAGVLKELRGEQ